MPSHDPAALLQLAKTGDKAAYLELIALSQRGLRVFVAAFAASSGDVETTLRAVVATGFRELAKAPDDGQFAAWLRGIAFSLLPDHLARSEREAAGKNDELLRLMAVAARDRLAGSGADADLEAPIQARYNQLPRGAQELLSLRYAKGLLPVQLSEKRGMSGADIAIALHTARSRLEWRSDLPPDQGGPDHAFVALVEDHLAGTSADGDRAQLALEVVKDAQRPIQFVQLVRLHLIALALLAPAARYEEQLLAAPTTRAVRPTTRNVNRPSATGSVQTSTPRDGQPARPPARIATAAPGVPAAAHDDSAARTRTLRRERTASENGGGEQRALKRRGQPARTIALAVIAICLIAAAGLFMWHRPGTATARPTPGTAPAPGHADPPLARRAADVPLTDAPTSETTPIWSTGTNLVPAPTAAYALRRLHLGHQGALVRVRRGRDNAELAIGATAGGELDSAALLAFAAGPDAGPAHQGNAYVTVWYDQSGNGNDMVQDDPKAQPRLVSSGAIEMQHGRPALSFTTAQSQHLVCKAALPVGTLFAAVYGRAAPGATGLMGERTAVVAQGFDAFYAILQRDQDGKSEWWLGQDGLREILYFPTPTDQLFLWESSCDGAALPALGAAADGAPPTTLVLTHAPETCDGPTCIGCTFWQHRVVDFLDGYIGELIMLPANQTANARGIVRANLKAYWLTP